MISKIKRTLLGLVAALTIAVPVLAPQMAGAVPDIQKNLCQGSTLNLKSDADCTDIGTANNPEGTLTSKIASFLNLASKILGAVAVIMIIFAGFKYVTSGGNKEGVSSAKSMIVYAIVGLIIVAIAQAIVQFVLTSS